jgi:hypothetical protein
MRVVYHRTLLGVLADRGIRLHAVAEWCRIPITELRRLLEFGSPLDAEAAGRLVAWGTRMVEISWLAKPPVLPPPFSPRRLVSYTDDEGVRPAAVGPTF